MNKQVCVIPEEIFAKAAKASESLLPKKSEDMYDKEYNKFDSWMVNTSVEIINETVLLGYFEELSESFSPNSLWTKYSMLKKTILIKKKIDIWKFHILGEYLKQGSKGYETKKSKVLTRDEVLKFIHEAPNTIYLMTKVALLLGVFGGCRRQELVNMLVDHIEDRGSILVVNIPEFERCSTIYRPLLAKNFCNFVGRCWSKYDYVKAAWRMEEYSCCGGVFRRQYFFKK